MYQDETLACTDCGAPFTFTAGEQTFYATKGFTNKPNRCPDCRAARKAQGGRGGGASAGGGAGAGAGYGAGRPERQMFSARCSQCGNEAKVPFEPRSDKPVYCRDCFQSRQAYR
jgi:CxxC-x17-CxxC domain-containing protein